MHLMLQAIGQNETQPHVPFVFGVMTHDHKVHYREVWVKGALSALRGQISRFVCHVPFGVSVNPEGRLISGLLGSLWVRIFLHRLCLRLLVIRYLVLPVLLFPGNAQLPGVQVAAFNVARLAPTPQPVVWHAERLATNHALEVNQRGSQRLPTTGWCAETLLAQSGEKNATHDTWA